MLWHVPHKSPDLNTSELFWAWLCEKLRALDLKDAVAKQPVLGKMAYKQRVRQVCASKAPQKQATACALRLKKNCKLIIYGRAIKG